MDFHVDSDQFDIKHEEDPLSITQIKSEPQAIENEIKTEAKDYDMFPNCEVEHVDIKPVPHFVAFLPEVESKSEILGKLLDDAVESQLVQKNKEEDESIVMPIIHNPCETYGTELQEDKCDVICEHAEKKANKCSACYNLFLHNQNKYTNVDKFLKCKICDKLLSNKRTLIRHSLTHTGEKPFTCSVCNKSFSRKCGLIEHTRVHTNEKPYTCNFCNKAFSFISGLSVHIRTHTNEKPFTCNICKKTFSNKSNLTNHARIHTNEKPFICELCSKSFSRKYYLNSHKLTHTSLKPFTCGVCNKTFPQKFTLTAHIRTHTHEKPFMCNVCKKTFSTNCLLIRHARRTHSNEKPFKCEICNKSFIQKHHLVRHALSHKQKVLNKLMWSN